MLDKPTVFVIGAGAGFDIDMPLGDKLADLIAGAVSFYYEKGLLTKGNVHIADALQRISQRKVISWDAFLIAGRMIASGIQYTRSIDNFVHTHSDKEAVKTAAKVAIVQTILEAERECDISIDPQQFPPRFLKEEKARKSWLSDFFTMLQDGIIEAKNLDEIFSNLTIVNFNYDRCVEHYLFHVMQRLYPSKGEAYVTELINATLKIIHPYGSVGNLPWRHKTNAVRFGGERDGNDLESLANQIRTYNEEVDDKKKIGELRTIMAEAKRIIFLGFHYHKQNVELLAPEPLEPTMKGTVVIYGTNVGRSFADVEMIENRRMSKILHGRTVLPSSSFTTERGCKELFRDFGGVLSG
jgi:hypothetical protein